MATLRVLTACEESQAVTIEMRRLGHEAYSCDIQDCSGGHPEWHIKGDALAIINGGCRFQTMDGEWHEIDGPWDLLIAHPPCTHLAVSGARHFAQKRADGRQQAAIEFFMAFINANCPRIVVENPVGVMSTEYRKPDQTISPWQYALTEEEHTEKKTCLWFVGGGATTYSIPQQKAGYKVSRMDRREDRQTQAANGVVLQNPLHGAKGTRQSRKQNLPRHRPRDG